MGQKKPNTKTQPQSDEQLESSLGATSDEPDNGSETASGSTSEEVQEASCFRLREDFKYVLSGMRHQLKAGYVFDSHNFDVDHMLAQGAQVDVIDEDGNVLLDLNDM